MNVIPALSHACRKFRAFGKETVAGVDGVRIGLSGGPDHLFDIEIILDRALPQHYRLFGKPDEIGIAVGPFIGDDGFEAQLLDRPHYAQGDFAPVGYHDLVDSLYFRLGGVHQRPPPGSACKKKKLYITECLWFKAIPERAQTRDNRHFL